MTNNDKIDKLNHYTANLNILNPMFQTKNFQNTFVKTVKAVLRLGTVQLAYFFQNTNILQQRIPTPQTPRNTNMANTDKLNHKRAQLNILNHTFYSTWVFLFL